MSPTEVLWCDRCGQAAAEGSHAACAAARALEPPRFCPHCRRRMKVQVLPAGWSAVCVAHGELRAAGQPVVAAPAGQVTRPAGQVTRPDSR